MPLSQQQQLEIDRFKQSLTQLMVKKKLSQRKACDKIDITIGTMTKYLRGEVNPFDVKTRITRNLARELGLTPEALYSFFETGEYSDSVTIDDVESWIKSTSVAADLPRILDALSSNQSQRLEESSTLEKEIEEKKQKYKRWIMGTDVKRFTKVGSKKFAKTVEQLFQEECERRGLSKEEAIRELTPHIQKAFHMEYWGEVIQSLSKGQPIPASPEIMKAVYEEHDKKCPCVTTFHEWLCSSGHTNCERLEQLEACLADAAVLV